MSDEVLCDNQLSAHFFVCCDLFFIDLFNEIQMCVHQTDLTEESSVKL